MLPFASSTAELGPAISAEVAVALGRAPPATVAMVLFCCAQVCDGDNSAKQQRVKVANIVQKSCIFLFRRAGTPTEDKRATKLRVGYVGYIAASKKPVVLLNSIDLIACVIA